MSDELSNPASTTDFVKCHTNISIKYRGSFERRKHAEIKPTAYPPPSPGFQLPEGSQGRYRKYKHRWKGANTETKTSFRTQSSDSASGQLPRVDAQQIIIEMKTPSIHPIMVCLPYIPRCCCMSRHMSPWTVRCLSPSTGLAF